MSFVPQNSENPFKFFRYRLLELLFVCLSVSLCAMCLALCDVFVLKMNFTVYMEIWRSRINNTFGRSIVGVRDCDGPGIRGPGFWRHHTKTFLKHFWKPVFFLKIMKIKEFKNWNLNRRFERDHFNPLKTGSHAGYNIEVRIHHYS